MRKGMELTRLLWIAALVLAPLGLASCAPKEGEENDEPEVVTPSEAETAEPVTVDIDEWKDSNVSGEATINRAGNNLNVAISLEELPADGSWSADLVAGKCDALENLTATTGANTKAPATPATPPQPSTTGVVATPGTVLSPLGMIMASTTPSTTPTPGTPAPGRTGTLSGTVPLSALMGVTEAFIRVQGGTNAPVACGNIDDLDKLTMAAGTVTPPSTVPSTTPAPGARP